MRGSVGVAPGDLADTATPIVGLALDFDAGTRLPFHRHLRHQLLYARSGVMRTTTDAGTWVVPAYRAVWIPARVGHEVSTVGRVAMRTLYFHPEGCYSVPLRCRVLDVSPLMRELLLRVVQIGRLSVDVAAHRRLQALLLDEIRALPVAPLHLPAPGDPRLRSIASALLQDPADARSLAAWGRHVGASPRTLARLFVAETGSSFGRWRQQARLVVALEGLAAGNAVKVVAAQVGYSSASAFVAMFRRALGTTPRRYFERATEPDAEPAPDAETSTSTAPR